LASREYGVLLYDSRASGDSEGKLYTWGDREREDVRAAVDFLAGQPAVKRIGALGFSVGAYSLSGAALKDDRIEAIVLEGASPSLSEAEEWDDRPYGLWVAYPTRLLYRWYGVRFEEVDVVGPLRAMSPRPTFVVIGSADPYIPRWMTEEVFASARGRKALYVVEGAEHGGYARAGGDAYLNRVADFFDDAFGMTPSAAPAPAPPSVRAGADP
jgi:fermentation-respiration switch protein FrsA (DUF1100 family)